MAEAILRLSGARGLIGRVPFLGKAPVHAGALRLSENQVAKSATGGKGIMGSLFANIDPLYVISGVLVGSLVGFTGVGGGSLMTPILILVFGIHPSTAVGTDLLYASITKTGGSFVHGYHKTIEWKVVGLLALGSVPFTALTILMLYVLKIDSKATQSLISNILGVALLFTACSLLFRKPLMRWFGQNVKELNPNFVRSMTILTGAVLGVLV